MANPLRPAVNQRLYFARLHLNWMAEQINAERLARRLVEQALGESVILHLVMAYRSYLSEVAEAYQLPIELPGNAAALNEALRESGIESAECNELLALEQGDGWLTQLLQAFDAIGREASVKPAQAVAADSIAVQAVDDGLLGLQPLESVYQSLQQVIESQRVRLEEW